MATGDKRLLGTLYINNTKIKRPLKPYGMDANGSVTGDIATYPGGNIEIRDSDASDSNKLQWVEVNDRGKTLLICDRVLFTSVKRDVLNSQGLIYGKTVNIDGKQYKLRSLTGGETHRGSDYYSGGSPNDNEWDRYIVNEGNIPGLPFPSASDRDKNNVHSDYTSPHNTFWNWYNVSSITQEVSPDNLFYMSRGHYSALYVAQFVKANSYPTIGFRPVLEEIKPKFYYDKYNVVKTWNEPPRIGLNDIPTNMNGLYKTKSWDSINKKWVGSGNWEAHEYTNIGSEGFIIDLPGTTLTEYVSRQYARADSKDHLRGYGGRLASSATEGPGARGTLVTSNIVADEGTYPENGKHSDGFWYVKKATANAFPTLILNTTDNRTLYENDTFLIEGQANDSDNGNIINVKYQINGGTIRAIDTKVSDGITPLFFNKQLRFKNGKLLDGETELTTALAENTPHQLRVGSEDDQGGKSAEQIRTFYVVPNRAPVITVDSIANQNDLINSDKLTISGTTSDPDSNDVIVKYKINSGLATQVYSGPAGEWTFDILLKDLLDGENRIVVEVTDTYNFKTSKTIKLNKTANLTPLSESVQRYKIVSPTGSAQGVLLWIQRSEDLVVSAEISMTNGSEQETYTAMTLTNSAPVSLGILEDEFTFQADTAKENINVKLNITGIGAVTLISGVLN